MDYFKVMNTNPNAIRILTVDDHALLREGIAALVNAEPDMKLVAEASNGQEAIEKFRLHRPDVTLMDLQMPELNGIEAIISIHSEFPHARIIVLTTYSGDAQVLRALRAGAQGYILKGQVRKDLLETIRAVHAGKANRSGKSPPNSRIMPRMRLATSRWNSNRNSCASCRSGKSSDWAVHGPRKLTFGW